MPLIKDNYKGPDPDPTQYLFVSIEAKAESAAKPYDAKKSCWVACPQNGYVLGEIRGAKGDQITVFANNKEQTLKKDQVLQVNPPKFEKMEDMSNLTYLNDATVLWNLKDRYYNKLIYVCILRILKFWPFRFGTLSTRFLEYCIRRWGQFTILRWSVNLHQNFF